MKSIDEVKARIEMLEEISSKHQDDPEFAHIPDKINELLWVIADKLEEH